VHTMLRMVTSPVKDHTSSFITDSVEVYVMSIKCNSTSINVLAKY